MEKIYLLKETKSGNVLIGTFERLRDNFRLSNRHVHAVNSIEEKQRVAAYITEYGNLECIHELVDMVNANSDVVTGGKKYEIVK